MASSFSAIAASSLSAVGILPTNTGQKAVILSGRKRPPFAGYLCKQERKDASQNGCKMLAGLALAGMLAGCRLPSPFPQNPSSVHRSRAGIPLVASPTVRQIAEQIEP